MSRKGSAGTMFWGLTLIVAGIIFLLKNMGFNVPIWTGVATYWPVLLIAWGVLKLVDYYRWKRAGGVGNLFSGGEVALLILVILGGTALTTAANISPDIGEFFEMANIDLFEVTGNSYEYTEHYEHDARSGAAINITNRFGGIEVRPAMGDRIVLDVKKTVIAADQKQADELSKLFTYSINEEGGAYHLRGSFNRESNVRGRRFKTSLIVQVPKHSAVDIDNRNGDVDVADLIGDQDLTNAFGPTTVRNIIGSIAINSRNADVHVEEITGDVRLKNEFAGTKVQNVTGKLELRTRNGDVDVSDIKSEVQITNEFAPVRVSQVRGQLTIRTRNGPVEVENVEDSLTIRNEFDHVTVSDARGEISVNNRNGEVAINFSQPPVKNIHVNSEYAGVTLAMPSASTFTIDARTQYAEVESEFLGPVLNDRDGQRNSFIGPVGSGGPEIRITNKNGHVRLEKR